MSGKAIFLLGVVVGIGLTTCAAIGALCHSFKNWWQ